MSTHHLIILWPHGLKDAEYITFDIFSQKWLRLIGYWRRQVRPELWDVFLTDIYATSQVPREHIQAKTEYLKNCCGQMMCYLVEDFEPDEQWVGDGVWRQRQDVKLQAWKQSERDRWNPRIPGTHDRSEDHVLHSTDIGEETPRLLNLLDIPTIELMHRNDDKPIRCSPFVEPFEHEIREVRLDTLKVNQVGEGTVPLRYSIVGGYALASVRCAEGDYPYLIAMYNYWRRTAGLQCFENHHPMAYNVMLDSWHPGDPRDLPVVCDNVIIDGAHRCAAMMYRDGLETALVASVTKWL